MVLEINNLTIYYRTRRGIVQAVNQVSFSLKEGKTVALIGESGSGKSSIALGILRILPKNTCLYKGSVRLDDVELTNLSEDALRKEIRWKKISLVMQEAMETLNPLMKVGEQVAEPLMVHESVDKKDALQRAINMLEAVGLPDYVAGRYSHELSGGMKQRVIIAMALILKPKVVILDEPTSALDVITQANLINLLKDLQWDQNLSYVFITHDISLANEIADQFVVMYAGKLAEIGDANSIISFPAHPYTKGLIASIPSLKRETKIMFIPGEPPNLMNPPPGCRFYDRCEQRMDICKNKVPSLVELDHNHKVACLLYDKGE